MNAIEEPPARTGRPRRDDWQERFLDAFSSHGVQAWAARAVSISPDTVQAERRRNADFAARYDEAFEMSTAVLERRAVQWAAAGIPTETVTETTVTKQTPTVVDGQTVMATTTTTTRTATTSVDANATMLIFLLKARRPDVYRERQYIEHTGAEGGAIVVESIDAIDRQIAQLTEELAARERAG